MSGYGCTRRFLGLLLLTVLGGCHSALYRIDLVHGLINQQLTDDLMASSRYGIVKQGLTRHGQFYLTPLPVTMRTRIWEVSQQSYAWLETGDTGFALLLVVDGDRADDIKVERERGWQVDPQPMRTELLDNKFNPVVEGLLPPVTAWSQIYMLWYPSAQQQITLRRGSHTLVLSLP